MEIDLASIVIDTADLPAESAFWHGLLGGTLTRGDDHHFLQIDGFPVLVVQRSPSHVAPDWPEGAPQQMHFDLTTNDMVAADSVVLDAGGRRLAPVGEVGANARDGRVYASPSGHPFCFRTT